MPPLFSVLVPTKNRAKLLKFAIRSVLQQSCNDFELVISDNNSKDDTRTVVGAFADRRIQYVHTGSDIACESNWNNTYRHASGKYVMCIGDDDVLLPACLERYANAIREWNSPALLFSNYAVYYPNDFFVDNQKNTVLVQLGEGMTRRVDVAPLLNFIFTTLDVPFPTQPICYSRELLEKVSPQEGPYQPIHPDYFCLVSVLLHCSTCIGVSKPLVLQGRYNSSAGVSSISTEGRKVYTILEDQKITRGVKAPLPGNFFVNGHYVTLQLVKLRFPKLCQYDTRDLKAYYAGCDYQLRLWRRQGLELTPSEIASEQKLRHLPLEMRAYLAYRRVQRKGKDLVPLVLQNLYTALFRSRTVRLKLDSGIRNIEECASWLVEHKYA